LLAQQEKLSIKIDLALAQQAVSSLNEYA